MAMCCLPWNIMLIYMVETCVKTNFAHTSCLKKKSRILIFTRLPWLVNELRWHPCLNHVFIWHFSTLCFNSCNISEEPFHKVQECVQFFTFGHVCQCLVLGNSNQACFMCLPPPTHLIQMIRLLLAESIINSRCQGRWIRVSRPKKYLQASGCPSSWLAIGPAVLKQDDGWLTSWDVTKTSQLYFDESTPRTCS